MFGNDDWVDLGDYHIGEMGHHNNYDSSMDDNYYRSSSAVVYQYYFKDYEDLVTSDVFQKALSMSLAHKDKEIESLRNEIMELS